MNKHILDIRNASIAFENQVLFTGLNFCVQKGQMGCITGESGSGKTSLLKSILGFIPLTEGEIHINGQSLCRESIRSIRHQIAWIPQELYIPAEWVQEMIDVPFKLRANQKKHMDRELLFSYFEELGLDRSLADRRVTEISGGQRQRIMIAATALLDKPLMIIDEPTSALDPCSIQKVIGFLHKQLDKGIAILVVTHDAIFANSCDIQISI